MTAAPPTAWRAVWLLTRLRLQRLLNISGRGLSFKKNSKSRPATPGKRGGRWLLGALLLLPMLFSFGSIARHSVLNMHCLLDQVAACQARGSLHTDSGLLDPVITQLMATPFSATLIGGLTLQLTLLWLVSVLLPLGMGELSKPDWDLEWLVTLPVRKSTLLWARVLERTLVNPAGLLALWPSTTVIAWYSGQGWFSPLSGLLASLVLLVLAAMLRTLVDTGLRLSLTPSRLGNLQAVISLAGLLPMYMGMSFGMGTGGFAYAWAAAMPAWSSWTPPGLLLRLLNADGVAALLPAIVLLAQCLCLMLLGMAILRRQLHHGVVGAGQREAARKPAAAPSPTQRWRPRIGTAIQRRELTLLLRDRNFLVQALLMPLLILGGQALFTGQVRDVHALLASPVLLASTGFFLGTYVLLMSAFQTLNKEGGALWLLYTFPVSIEQALRQKAQLWALLALLYPLILFGAALAWLPAWSWQTAGLMLLALAGIPLYALIAVALGVFASDPLATETTAKVRPTYMYLYLLLTGLYIAALAAGSLVQQLVFVVFTGALAVALWQKARDALPCLLDPAASPPATVAAADGLIAAMLFFILQTLSLILLKGSSATPLAQLAIAFGAAGTLTYALLRLVYWRARTAGVPRIGQGRQPWRRGVAGACAAALFGIGCAALLPPPASPLMQINSDGLWLLAVGVLAAPLCEEFIFRGLLQGGLRRSLPAWQAIGIAAALFAIVHPPAAMLPVFVLGLCTGIAYERSGALLAPMLVHALYNAAMLGYQMNS
ncbi:CPBP family intramembrane metalloprotease [Janthinobacterium sp. PLB04]|uniref:CPBP family intramembrane metalloprotease n=1 Tax=Janthinobacterium lividum TaxID=29581 RepID=A0AAJ4MV41_9BURK|nr:MULTISPECIES: type II CAAX endopeptidase family protein [Janthinobacterium]KAB0331215.1 CPBP family intramembrane metalloprotease [Janthinobacterium lividum]QSX97407.1 CPBP family intramembrane metalloprotease [Janthinobacterium lividum]UGQ37337.1 CPBP family intramembrane metalloprotease [Janthinobacterium sp. PLB04]